MEDHEAKQIAKKVVEEFNTTGRCPNGMGKDDIETLKEMLPTMQRMIPKLDEMLPSLQTLSSIQVQAEKNIRRFVYGAVAIGFIIAFVTGILWHMKNILREFRFVILVVLAGILILLMNSCYQMNIEKVEYYPDGKIKSKTTDTSHGFDPKWSSGNDKQMPLSHINVSGVGI